MHAIDNEAKIEKCKKLKLKRLIVWRNNVSGQCENREEKVRKKEGK